MKINVKRMDHQFFILMALVVPQFLIGSIVGEDKGTLDHWIYWPLVITIAAGLLLFLVEGVYLIIRKKKSK